MKAIICLAGEGKRLKPMTDQGPKGLIPIGEKTILEYLLENLSAVGVKDIVLVLGYKADEVQRKIGNSYKGCQITYIVNPDYATTDNLYSLWLAREYSNEGMIFFNGDIIVHQDILRRAIESPHENNVVVDDTIELVDDSMKVHVDAGKLVDIGKTISTPANGWAIGIYRFSKAGAKRYFEIASKFFANGPQFISFVVPVRMMAQEQSIYAISTQSKLWVEIDTHEDYEQACGRIDEILISNE